MCSPGCGGGGGVVAVLTILAASESRDGDELDIYSSNQVRGTKLIKISYHSLEYDNLMTLRSN